MFEFFYFSLPRAVTEHLFERLDELNPSRLDVKRLKALTVFQGKKKAAQGVYVIYEREVAVYAGKANDVAARLSEHYDKLRARVGIDIGTIGFKALLLDENWSTSANETLLIAKYKERGECRWNGAGFGPKDPGKERDTTRPSWFDATYPVRDDWPIAANLPDHSTVGGILGLLKTELPFLLRYGKLGKGAALPVNLTGVPRTARAVLVRCAETLGDGWQLTLLKYGLILYPTVKDFEYGERLYPVGGSPS
jgi:hypothetical protein